MSDGGPPCESTHDADKVEAVQHVAAGVEKEGRLDGRCTSDSEEVVDCGRRRWREWGVDARASFAPDADDSMPPNLAEVTDGYPDDF